MCFDELTSGKGFIDLNGSVQFKMVRIYALGKAHMRSTPSLGSVQFSSVQFKMVSVRSGKLICVPPRLSGVSSSVQFSSVQDGIYALLKAHVRSTPSLRSFPNVSLETVPMLV